MYNIEIVWHIKSIMDNAKNLIIGGVVTLLIGGTAYTFSQQDVINNFAADTGLSQEQAELYVNSVDEDELASFSEVGQDYIEESAETLSISDEIDCINYEYEWESTAFTCIDAKMQLKKISDSELLLGRSYVRLDADDATEKDISLTITYIDQLNADYELEASNLFFDAQIMEEVKKTNSFNKAMLKAALESD